VHHMEMLSPTLRPEAAKPDPEDPIRTMKTGMPVGAQCDLALMPEDQVFESKIAARSDAGDERTKDKEEQLRHQPG
jgi:hypothetical protein